MTKPGPKPRPTQELLRRGSRDVKRQRANEPHYEAHVPAKPDHLSEIAGQVWDHYSEILGQSRVLTKADCLALEQLAECYSEWWQAEKIIRDEGMFYENPTSGCKHQHPSVQVRDRSRKHLARLLSEFGLTPSSRARVSALPDNKEKPKKIT